MQATQSPIASKPYWVKASAIMRLTGWNKAEMHRARAGAFGPIKWKHTETDGFQYDLNTVHPFLIKNAGSAVN